jgi:UrcA family protein
MQSSTARHRIVLATILMTLAGLSTASAANKPVEAKVVYYDLDLADPQNVTILYKRLDRAAKRVCFALDRKELSARRRFDNCRVVAVANAVAEIGAPTLLDYHRQHNGTAVASPQLAGR